MIAYFPTPYPDELFFSVVARYGLHTGRYTLSLIEEGLFKERHKKANVYYANDLCEDLDFLPHERIRYEYTMYPYFFRFFNTEKHKPQKNFYKSASLKYCPLCVKDDQKKFGEAYWHRQHMIPEIDICIKHRCRLISAGHSIVQGKTAMYYNCNESIKTLTPQYDISAIEMKTAEYITTVFYEPIPEHMPYSAEELIHFKLAQNGYMDIPKITRELGRLRTDVIDYYSEINNAYFPHFLEISNFFEFENNYPYDICLLAMYLGISPQDLAAGKAEKTCPKLTKILELMLLEEIEPGLIIRKFEINPHSVYLLKNKIDKQRQNKKGL